LSCLYPRDLICVRSVYGYTLPVSHTGKCLRISKKNEKIADKTNKMLLEQEK